VRRRGLACAVMVAVGGRCCGGGCYPGRAPRKRKELQVEKPQNPESTVGRLALAPEGRHPVPPQRHAAHCTLRHCGCQNSSHKRLLSSAEQVPAAQPLLVTHEGAKLQHASCTVTPKRPGEPFDVANVQGPQQRPCLTFTGGARTRRDLGGEASTSLEHETG
jgi:hypothetical protein